LHPPTNVTVGALAAACGGGEGAAAANEVVPGPVGGFPESTPPALDVHALPLLSVGPPPHSWSGLEDVPWGGLEDPLVSTDAALLLTALP
jgi:hypothetical protein